MKALQILKKYPWHFAGIVWIFLIVIFIILYSLMEDKQGETTHHHNSEAVNEINH